MKQIQLTKRQIKAADRVGGMELLIPWPLDLGAANVEEECERDTKPAEHAYAERITRRVCRVHGLVPVRSAAVKVRRPSYLAIAPGEMAFHLAIVLIGHRWVHAQTGGRAPRTYFLGGPGRES